jgi:hypothetical protein
VLKQARAWARGIVSKSTSYRVRDKIAASKRKGLWVGGPIPLGYATVKKKLIVVPEEARRSAPCSDFTPNAVRSEP